MSTPGGVELDEDELRLVVDDLVEVLGGEDGHLGGGDGNTALGASGLVDELDEVGEVATTIVVGGGLEVLEMGRRRSEGKEGEHSEDRP